MKKLTGHAISGVFVFLLLGIFAVMGTVTVLMGANTYKNSGDTSNAHNEERILANYIRSMARSCDEADSISIERVPSYRITAVSEDELDSVPAGQLVTETIEDETYYSRREDLGETECVALVISSVEDEIYIDRIYVCGGYLMENLQQIDEPFEPERGMTICPAEQMSASITNGLMDVSIISQGRICDVAIALRCASQGGTI